LTRPGDFSDAGKSGVGIFMGVLPFAKVWPGFIAVGGESALSVLRILEAIALPRQKAASSA
jgi:hypothetical protein